MMQIISKKYFWTLGIMITIFIDSITKYFEGTVQSGFKEIFTRVELAFGFFKKIKAKECGPEDIRMRNCLTPFELTLTNTFIISVGEHIQNLSAQIVQLVKYVSINRC